MDWGNVIMNSLPARFAPMPMQVQAEVGPQTAMNYSENTNDQYKLSKEQRHKKKILQKVQPQLL